MKDKIKKTLKEIKWINEEYDIYKRLCSNFNITPLNQDEYIKEIYTLFECDINYKLEIVDDDILNEYEYLDRITHKQEYIKEQDIEELKDIINKDHYEVINIDYHDQNFIITEDLTCNLDLSKTEFDKYFKVGGYHDSVLYFSFDSDKIDIDDEDINETDYTLKDAVEDSLQETDLHHFNIYLMISLNEDKFKHNDPKNVDKEYKILQDKAKSELFNRITENKKNIKNKELQLINIKEMLNDSETKEKLTEISKKFEVLNNCIFDYQEKLKQDIQSINNENEDILK